MKKIRYIFMIAVLSIWLSSCSFIPDVELPDDPIETVYDLYLSVEETHHNINDKVKLHVDSDAKSIYTDYISFEITNNTASIDIELVWTDDSGFYYVTANQEGQATIKMLYDDDRINNSDTITLYFNYAIISTPEEFMAINDSTLAYKLANDLDFSGISYQTIKSFSGSLDGHGYSLKNLYLEASTDENHAIFDVLTESSSITDLTIENFYLDAFQPYENLSMLAVDNHGDISHIEYTGYIFAPSSLYVGGLVAYNYGSLSNIIGNIDIHASAYVGGLVARNEGTIMDITTHGEITSLDVTFDGANPIAYIGGISGYSQNTIKNTTNHIKILSHDIGKYIGGISGYYEINNDIPLENLRNHGDIDGESYVAGIFGNLNATNGSYSNYTLNNLKNEGHITSRSDYSAGIIAHHQANEDKSAIMTKLSNNQSVISIGSYTGGIIGFSSAKGSFLDTHNTGLIEGDNYVGGILGYSKSLTVSYLSNEGQVKGSKYVGGIIGYGSQLSHVTNYGDVIGVSEIVDQYIGGIAGLSSKSIQDAENYGHVTAYQQGNFIGGISGIFHPSTSTEIYNIINEGNVTGGNYVGGFFGDYVSTNNVYKNYTHSLSNMTNKGDIQGINYVGGISGRFYPMGQNNLGIVNYEKISFTSIKNQGDITGENYIGGIAGYIRFMQSHDYTTNEGVIIGEGQEVNDLFGFIHG